MATEFHRSVADIAFTITLALAMRPLGHLSSDGAPTAVAAARR
jgi:hypothetical protein